MKKKKLNDYLENIRRESLEEGYSDRPVNPEERYMVLGDLRKINDMSSKLFFMIKKHEADIEEWNQIKISKAADYLSSVYDYLAYTNVEDSDEE
jgi:hypothetical protein